MDTGIVTDKKTVKTVIIEENDEGCIVDDDRTGRLYLRKRRRHEALPATYRDGIAFKIHPKDTLATIQKLDEIIWNDYSTGLDAFLMGYDDQRPMLSVNCGAIYRRAAASGLYGSIGIMTDTKG